MSLWAVVTTRARVFVDFPKTVSEACLLVEHSRPSAPETRVYIAVLQPIKVYQLVLSWAWRNFDLRKSSAFRLDCPEFCALILAWEVVAWTVRVASLYSLQTFVLNTSRFDSILVLGSQKGT